MIDCMNICTDRNGAEKSARGVYIVEYKITSARYLILLNPIV